MRNEGDCQTIEKYLVTDEIISDETIDIWKMESSSRLKAEQKGELFDKFMNWKRSENERVLFTMYAYADLKIPKKFDCIFNLRKPSEFVLKPFKLTQILYESFLPIDRLEHGHKHTCIFEFDDDVPEMINKLFVSTGKYSNIPKDTFRIGICDSNDFTDIRKFIELKWNLIEKHGSKWLDYLDTEKDYVQQQA